MTRTAIGSGTAAAVLLLSLGFAVHEGRRFLADLDCESGLRRFRAGQFESAIEAYDHAVAQDGRSIEARYRRGGAQATLASLADAGGDREQSRRYLERAAEDLEAVARFAPHYASVEFRLGVVRAAQGRDGDAAPLLREAMRRDPNTPDGWRYLAQSLLRTGSADEASHAADEAARQDPWNAEIHAVAAHAERARGKTTDAIARLRDAEACAPRDAALRLRRASWLADEGRTSEAMDEAFIGAYRGGKASYPELEALASRFANDPRPVLISAVAHRIAGDREGSLRLYEEWARRSTLEFRQAEGLDLARAGDWSAGSARLASFEDEVMARIDPDFLPERVLAFAVGRGVLPELRGPDTRRRAAGVLRRVGRDDLALPILEEAVRDAADRPLARLVLAETYERLDRLDEARVHAQECLRQGFGAYHD
ncbi:MAG: tetratricopeptide repeat protein [Planctomycetes bacterium]|nr:tetratricopeptide repeat protein [Planctomycetota bacterium]